DNNVLGIKPKNDSILAEYIFYFMKFVKLENYSESTTVPSVRKSELEKIKIRVPSIQNQQKIISILENIDKTKKSNTESLKKL
ncbi:restriction endonuclease subunit S, partial [Citrobacter sp. UMB8248A]|nr:restriction endonuclease subunit S [Citrobacter sp. UMB8248A]